MLKLVYAFFLGLLLAFFIGVGISAFYPAPKYPEYSVVQQEGKPLSPTEQRIEQEQWEKYNADSKVYNRNVSIVVVVYAVLLMAAGLLLSNRTDFLSNGLLLGGTFSLVYSIIRSFASQDSKLTFVVVTVGLIATMTLGYIKFIRPQNKPAKKSARKTKR